MLIARLPKSRFLNFAILAFLGLLIAFVGYKYLRLALTLPLFFFGASLLLGGFALRDPRLGGSKIGLNKAIQCGQLLAILCGVTSLMMSVVFSVLNIAAHFLSPLSLPNQSLTRKNLGRYLEDNHMFWLHDELLGYSYKPNERAITSKSVLVNEKGNIQEVVYDVVYNIDEHGNRVSTTPRLRKQINQSAVFLGGSFAFGEGLQDKDTLASLFSSQSGLTVYNLGMHGYGPHQGLMQLSSPELRKKRIGSERVEFVFYRFIPDHVARAAGYSSWDTRGPCYRLNSSQTLEHIGSFEQCRPPITSFILDPLLKRLSASNEVWTSTMSGKLLNYRPHKLSDRELRTFVSIVQSMKDYSSQIGAKFVVLVEDIGVKVNHDSGSASCFVDQYAQLVSNELKKEDIDALVFSEFYSPLKCASGEYVINPTRDGHPSRVANLQWAQQLIDLYLGSFSAENKL